MERSGEKKRIPLSQPPIQDSFSASLPLGLLSLNLLHSQQLTCKYANLWAKCVKCAFLQLIVHGQLLWMEKEANKGGMEGKKNVFIYGRGVREHGLDLISVEALQIKGNLSYL